MLGFLRVLGVIFAVMVGVFLLFGLLVSLPWWGMMSGLIVIGIIVLWIFTFWDIFRRADMSVASIIIWVAAIVIFPILGTVVYFFARPPAESIQYRGETVQ
jgi:hypothetical protein